MLRVYFPLLCTLWLSLPAFAYPTKENIHRNASTNISVYKDVPGPPNLENLVVRRNGEILVTSTATPFIYLITPNTAEAPTAVAQVPNATMLTGIMELRDNVFIVAAADPLSPGSNAVWRLDMDSKDSNNSSTHANPQLSLLARIPYAKQLNGMTRIAKNDTSQILISDSAAGNIIRLDVVTGDHAVVISDPTMLPTSEGINVGVNGIHTWGDQLFYTSLDQGHFARIPISLSSGAATGPADIIVNGTLEFADDFVLSRDGQTAWITENGVFVLIEVDILARTSRVRFNDTLLAATSSAALGQSCSNWDSMYVTGARLDANSTAVEGRVIEVKLDTF
ncbi:hypothetical protein C7974DRAFT_474816 [Boeremia exigua]|uniref:uncharacterized protein n=1 Tax=Boeremia exigua TaxID=749465 RepID=UPI001E8DC7F8|nr:uncharacterized protein C7974DRAFT_474816 [Boeremia exigua]KAH6616289.1 hypothetical protein C7974DRAFT_474816 [Boeremia exigua]